MSTAPKKPDSNTGAQGLPLASVAPQSNDNENRRYEVIERGQLHTLNYRCYFRDVQTKTIVSPFHDIPLVNEQHSSTGNQGNIIYNMIVEVPRWANAKMEINKQLKMNPIVQDVKSGEFFPFFQKLQFGFIIFSKVNHVLFIMFFHIMVIYGIMVHYHKHGKIQIILMKILKQQVIMIHQMYVKSVLLFMPLVPLYRLKLLVYLV